MGPQSGGGGHFYNVILLLFYDDYGRRLLGTKLVHLLGTDLQCLLFGVYDTVLFC